MVHWYTADLHFGHENIIGLCGRPFRHADHMDRVLLANLWTHVGLDDDLWIVGDFAWGKKSKDEDWLAALFGQLPGARKHLVIGNHDHGPTQSLPWDSISHLSAVRDGAGKVPHTLCHYPMVTWNRARHGALQLFGHVHNNWQGTRNSVNVGVDVWDFKPMRIDDIRRRASKLPVNRHWNDAEPRSELGG